MTDRDHLDMDVTVHDHDGPEDADDFEQFLTDAFSMYRNVDVSATVAGDDAGDADELDYEEQDVPQDQISVHWMHPRTELELPVLAVWPGPVVDQWAAEVDPEGRATVTVHEWLEDVSDDDADEREIEKFAEPVEPEDAIPRYLADALRSYDGEYGPVTDVVNPVVEDADDADGGESDDSQTQLSEIDT